MEGEQMEKEENEKEKECDPQVVPLSEMKYEVYADSMTDAYICLSLNQLQSLIHNNGIKEKYKYSYSKSLQ